MIPDRTPLDDNDDDQVNESQEDAIRPLASSILFPSILDEKSPIQKKSKVKKKSSEKSKSSLVPWLSMLAMTVVLVMANVGRGSFVSFDLPYSSPVGLHVDNNEVSILDWYRKVIYKHDMKQKMRIQMIESVPNELPVGATFANDHLWTLDGLNLKLIQHKIAPNFPVIQELSVPGEDPHGLVWDGEYFWSGDKAEMKLYRHDPEDLERVIHTYTIPGDAFDTFFVRENRAWVVDVKSQELVVYRMTTPMEPLRRFNLALFIGKAFPVGLYVGKKDLWILTKSPSKLFSISRSRLEKSPADSF